MDIDSTTLAPLDFDKMAIDVAMATLDDIRPCSRAGYRVRWDHGIPFLVIAFDRPDLIAIPAVAVRLSTVPSNRLLDAARMRAHIRRSVEDYLLKCGVPLMP